MRLLLDTHALVWWVGASKELSRKALDALEDPDNRLFFSAAAAWEFQWIQARGRIEVVQPLDDILANIPLQRLDIPFDLHRYQATLPPIHGDPVDRIQIAQALQNDLTLVSRDGPIHRYPVRTLW